MSKYEPGKIPWDLFWVTFINQMVGVAIGWFFGYLKGSGKL